jgi:hypothetical protein
MLSSTQSQTEKGSKEAVTGTCQGAPCHLNACLKTQILRRIAIAEKASHFMEMLTFVFVVATLIQ